MNEQDANSELKSSQHKPKTALDEVKQKSAEYFDQFLDWLSFNEEESTFVNIARLFYKIPLTVLLTVLSPVYIIMIIIIFFASF